MKLTDFIALNGGKLPRIAGGATGTGVPASISNLPPESYEMNPAAWAGMTERQDIPLPSQAFPGLGQRTRLELTRVGVLSLIKLRFNGKLKTSAAGTSTTLNGWPYTLPREVLLKANGQTAIIDVRGQTLRARQRRLTRNAAESLESAPKGTLTASTEYAVAFQLDIPVAHDFLSLIGSLLAQNPQTTIEVDVVWAADGELFSHASSGTVEWLTSNVEFAMTTFSIGTIGTGAQTKTLLPDLTAFHGIIDNTTPIVGTGPLKSPLVRTSGQLLNYAFSIRNGEAAQIAPTALTRIALQYGGNRAPRVYEPPHMLLDKNQADYNGLVEVGTSGGTLLTFTYLDFEIDNPSRDLFIPEALVELQVEVQIPSSVTVNSGAYLLFAQESLYPAV